jgi:hypothetical protein
MNHTPGPWKVFNNREIGPISNDGDQSHGMMLPVAYIEQYDYPNDYEANARLIAAAPDLLKALQEITAWYEEEIGLPAVDAHAAIAKAKGIR